MLLNYQICHDFGGGEPVKSYTRKTSWEENYSLKGESCRFRKADNKPRC